MTSPDLIRNVEQLLASLPEKKRLVSVDQSVSVPDAAAAMKDNETHSVVVTNNGEPVGLISTADTSGSLVANGKRPSERHAFEIMSTQIISVELHDDINTVSRTMTEKNIGHIVVRTEKGWVILSIKEVLKAITDNEQELQDQFEMYKQSGWPPVS